MGDAFNERLKAHGVTTILNVHAESDDQVMRRATDRYLHLPIIDQMSPSLELLQRGINFITEELANGGVVYVHCNQGLGRGPTLVAAYMVSTGLSADNALKRIRHVRPFIRPTQQQIDQVTRFEHDRLGGLKQCGIGRPETMPDLEKVDNTRLQRCRWDGYLLLANPMRAQDGTEGPVGTIWCWWHFRPISMSQSTTDEMVIKSNESILRNMYQGTFG